MGSRHVWPVHPQPLPDEIFSSWLMRVAKANSQKLTSIFHLAVPDYKNFGKSIDSSIPKEAVELMAYYLRTPIQVALDTSLNSYEGVIFEASTPKLKHKTGILNTGETRHNLHYQQFCPVCLSDGVPYFRKTWRVSSITVCTKHGCVLLDRCPECNSAVIYMNNDNKSKHDPFRGEITECFSCGFDLRKASVQQAHPKVLVDAMRFEKSIQNGSVELLPQQWIYSFSFFCVLRHLMRTVIEMKIHSNSKNNVDCLPVVIRYAAMIELAGLFDLWPSLFLQYCLKNNIGYSLMTSMTKTCDRIPFWFSSQVKEYLYSPNIEPTKLSVITAIQLMIKRGERVNVSSVNKFLGYVDSQSIKATVREWQFKPH